MKKQYYVVRTKYAGVFFGEIKERSAAEVTMMNVRKLWYWDGACAVEQLAVDGVAFPHNCQFTVIVSEMVIAEPIQIIPCTDKATKSLESVKPWKK